MIQILNIDMIKYDTLTIYYKSLCIYYIYLKYIKLFLFCFTKKLNGLKQCLAVSFLKDNFGYHVVGKSKKS